MTQELKNLGIKHILLDVQTDFISQMTGFFAGKKNRPCAPISTNDSIRLQVGESRKFLAGIGLQGEIIHEGFAFTGNLHPLFILPEDDIVSRASWDTIHKYKVKTIFPGHGTKEST